MRRTAPGRKEATHERIVEAAARAIRRSGYKGTGVADIMKDAGLTHGGFYAHFGSREAMLAEAADRAGAEAVAASARIAGSASPQRALLELVRAYLSRAHVEDIERGCPVAALGSEMPRQAPEVRRAATRRIKEMNGRTALVTGASSGIGAATAERLAMAGYKVYGTSRRGAQAGKRPFEMLPLDVTGDDSVQTAVGEVIRSEGRIDVLVNNAGFSVAPAGAEESSIDHARSIVDTN